MDRFWVTVMQIAAGIHTSVYNDMYIEMGVVIVH